MFRIIVVLTLVISSLNASSPLDQMKQIFLNQIDRVSVVELLLEHLSIQYQNNQGYIETGFLEYCSEEIGDIACLDKSSPTQELEQSILVRSLQYGFVGQDSVFSDEIIDIFEDNLCLVVVFKNNGQYASISPLLSGKQVVFCAKATHLGGMLIDRNNMNQIVDDDEVAIRNPVHGISSGWRCFNDPSFSANQGLSMGEIMIDGRTYGFLDDINSHWHICARPVTSDNS